VIRVLIRECDRRVVGGITIASARQRFRDAEMQARVNGDLLAFFFRPAYSSNINIMYRIAYAVRDIL
jgi:hypothetical protein